jgi:hypothetical protein
MQTLEKLVVSYAKKLLFIGAYTVTITFNALYFEIMVQLEFSSAV